MKHVKRAERNANAFLGGLETETRNIEIEAIKN